MGKLTAKQQAFVEHYLTCWNGSESARRAGYSAHTASEQAARLLADVRVQEAITQRLAELKATADEVLVRLTSHSRGSMDDFIGAMDRIDLEKARDSGVMPLIKKLRQRTTTISKTDGEDVETHEVELELYDAQNATVQLAKILGQYVDRLELTGANGGPVVTTVEVVKDYGPSGE
jgi:phage terminase small subunit